MKKMESIDVIKGVIATLKTVHVPGMDAEKFGACIAGLESVVKATEAARQQLAQMEAENKEDVKHDD